MNQPYMESMPSGPASSGNYQPLLFSGFTGSRESRWATTGTGNANWTAALIGLRPAVAAERTLVRFPSITAPTGCVIDTATLSLFQETTVGARTITAERITATWAEGTVTWNNQPATSTANAATSVTSGTNNVRQEWDVTQLVVDMLVNGEHGFMLKDLGSGDARQIYRSKEHSTAADRPHLILTFEEAP